jgi:hypothetical protein
MARRASVHQPGTLVFIDESGASTKMARLTTVARQEAAARGSARILENNHLRRSPAP